MSEGKTIPEMRHADRYSNSPDYADGYDDGIATQAAQIEALTEALEGADTDILACMKRLFDQNVSVAVQNTLNERLKLVRAALSSTGK